jgi:hypothetical protein
VSIFLPSPSRYVIWGVAMLIDLATPTRARRALDGASIVISHLTERFGTFFIIVLGESVTAVVAGVAGFEFTALCWIVAGISFVMALSLWWIYFDLADTSAGVAAFGEGTRLAIVDATKPGLAAGARWAMAGGIGAFALSLAVIHLGAEWTSLRDRTFSAGCSWPDLPSPSPRPTLVSRRLPLSSSWRSRCSGSCHSRPRRPAGEPRRSHSKNARAVRTKVDCKLTHSRKGRPHVCQNDPPPCLGRPGDDALLDRGADQGFHGRNRPLQRGGLTPPPSRGDPHVRHDRPVRRHVDSRLSC